MDSDKVLKITLQTIADVTGVTTMGQSLQRLNSEIQSIGSQINSALGVLGFGFAIHQLDEYGKKALEVREQQAAFVLQVLRSRDGSQELVGELNRLNEELEKNTGTTLGSSRAIERQLLLFGATREQVIGLTKAIIEFAAARGVNPEEVASLIARRIGGAADEADITLTRLGIKSKDVAGIMEELRVKGGQTAEAMVAASGGMKEFEIASEHLKIALGNVVNLLKIPFLTSFNEGLVGAKRNLDEVGKSFSSFGQAVFVASGLAGDAIGGLLGRSNLLLQRLYSQSQAIGGGIANFVLDVVKSVVGLAETLVTGAITQIDRLALHAADLARDLSGGLINIKVDTSQDEAAKSRIKDFADSVKGQLGGLSDWVSKKTQDAIGEVDKKFQEMLARGPSAFSAEGIKKLQEQYKAFINATTGQGVEPGSGVIDVPSAAAEKKSAEKAATDALTNAKYQLAAAEETYQAEVERTNALEKAGDISVSEADQQRRTAAQGYLAQLEKIKGELPAVIALLQSMGDTKGVAELKLELIHIDQLLVKTRSELQNTTFFGKIHAQLTQLKNDWSDLGKQLGGFLTQQFQNFANTASTVLTNLIFRTGNWKQSILELGQSFVQSLAQMVIQWVLARTVISALNKVFGSADAQATNAQATAAASAWAPAATAASIASYGVAAGTGLAAFLAAIGIGTAGAVAASSVGGSGFEEGGFTGGHAGQIAGVVHGSEYVISAPATRSLGVAFLDNLHKVGLSAPGYAAGGLVSPSSSPARSARPIINQALFLDLKAAQKWLRNRDGDSYIIDLVNSRGGHLRT